MTKHLLPLTVVLGLLCLPPAHAAAPAAKTLPRAILLPDYCNTPDAMAVLPDGNIILSVPNFTDPTSPGVLMKIAPDDAVSLFCKLPAHPQTGLLVGLNREAHVPRSWMTLFGQQAEKVKLLLVFDIVDRLR